MHDDIMRLFVFMQCWHKVGIQWIMESVLLLLLGLTWLKLLYKYVPIYIIFTGTLIIKSNDNLS